MATGTSGLAQKLIEGAGGATEAPMEWTSPRNTAMITNATNRVVAAGGAMVQTLIEKDRQRKEEEKQKSLGEWDKLANQQIEDSQYMTDDEYKTLTGDLMDGREEFANATKEEQAIMLNSMENKRDEIEKVKNFRTTLSVSVQDDDGILANKDWMVSDEGEEYKQILSGEKSMINQGGKYGYMMYDPKIQEDRIKLLEETSDNINSLSVEEDGDQILDLNKKREQLEAEIFKANLNPKGDQSFMTVYDMENTIKKQSFDRERNDKVLEFATNAQTIGSQVPQDSKSNFNYESTRSLVVNEIVDPGNMRSLIHDKHIGGKSFKEHLTKSLISTKDNPISYNDLGIDPELVKVLDPNGGGVTPADAKIIADQLLKDADMTKEYVTNFFTLFIKQNYEDGYNSRPKSSEEKKTNTTTSAFDGQL